MKLLNSKLTTGRLTFVLLIACLGSAHADFQGRVVVEWLMHGGDDRKVKLIESFAFVDASGKQWEVTKGAVVDGASIPRILWGTIGSPFVGDYRYASVIHDYYCDTKSESWKDTHRMFYDASIAAGVSKLKAKWMYGGVYAAGPRWKIISTTGLEGEEIIITDQEPPGISNTRLDELNDRIATDDISLDEIERFVDPSTDMSD